MGHTSGLVRSNRPLVAESRTLAVPCAPLRWLHSVQPPSLSENTITSSPLIAALAAELGVAERQVAAAVGLLDEGATVPFIARYRKEATGNLDDTQLRRLEERLLYLRELEERRAAVLQSILEQGKLDDALRDSLTAAPTKQALEDLYLPFKPRRRTRAQIAREAGLEPLALALWADPSLEPEVEARAYLKPAEGELRAAEANPFTTPKLVLEGARDILAERFGETAALVGRLRERLWKEGFLSSLVIPGKEGAEDEKFRDYYAYTETIRTIPSHRALALFRGRAQGVLTIKLGLGDTLESQVPHPCEAQVAEHFQIARGARAGDRWLADVCRWTWRVKLSPHLENEILTTLREMAQAEAIRIFATNLHELLLAAPAGPKVVLGIDPGIRTGCKIAVVDGTGKLLETATIYPHAPRNDWAGSLKILEHLAHTHKVELIAIGNGTASRDTDRLAADLIRSFTKEPGALAPAKIVVSEAGASVYSASELAAREFPALDVSLRGAVSIARRLQDPLAELVKIDPKAIGVGQYQHDVNQRELARALEAVVEDCVNAVGVDVNTASPPLLARVSGLNAVLARNIVEYRELHGPFGNRTTLKEVPRVGEKAYQLAAGFLRVNQPDHPEANVLDRSAVHPEAYPLVKRILEKLGKGISEVMGRRDVLEGVKPEEFVDQQFGLPTVRDVLSELEKPGRDPRPEFRAAQFREGVESLKDLVPGMVLEGVVTNVAAFGAFIDIGVHQDGLVHVSALAKRFVKDPREVVKPGQIVKVKILEVDEKRARIALTMRLDDDESPKAPKAARDQGQATREPRKTSTTAAPGAMALAFEKLKR